MRGCLVRFPFFASSPNLMSVSVLAILASAVVVPSPALAEKGGPKMADVLLSDEWPAIPPEHASLTEVPFAPGAPAVVLLNAVQDWDDDGILRRHVMYRIKILTDAGVERFGDFSWEQIGSQRVAKVSARTILPDGTIVDAKDGVFQEKSKSGIQSVRVAWPRVQVGAILDLHLVVNSDYIIQERFRVQSRVPVLESRLGISFGEGIRFRTAARGLTADQAKPLILNSAKGKLHVWQFRDVPALPEEPNQPDIEQIAQTLYVLPESMGDALSYTAYSTDWKAFGKYWKDRWEKWAEQPHRKATDLAKSVCGAGSAEGKAEAVRKALKDRFRVEFYDTYPNEESADALLVKGAGGSSDLAALSLVMLRACGVDAGIASLRHRDDGPIPTDFPMPILLNDIVLSLPTEGGPRWYSPTADLPAGRLPWYMHGVLAVPYDGVSDKPVLLPDFAAADNRTVRLDNVTIDAGGSLAGQSTLSFSGVAGERMRARLEDLDEAKRKEFLRDRLRVHVPGAEIGALTVEGLEDHSRDLVAVFDWTAATYATTVGKRLLVNPNLWAREDTADWSAETRTFAIDLDFAYETQDTLVLTIPDGVTVTFSRGTPLNAPQVGAYSSTVVKEGSKVTVKRSMRLDRYRFEPAAYVGLKRWFSDIARRDDEPIVLWLP